MFSVNYNTSCTYIQREVYALVQAFLLTQEGRPNKGGMNYAQDISIKNAGCKISYFGNISKSQNLPQNNIFRVIEFAKKLELNYYTMVPRPDP